MARHICDVQSINVLFMQESWLSPENLHKLCFISSNYLAFGISAMEHAVCNGILIGRPFGGMSTLINSKYKDFINEHICAERFN